MAAAKGAAKGFEEQAATLDALRGQSAEAAEPVLRKALQQRNNFLVAKAARVAGELRLTSLIAELAAAFRRFMPESGNDPAKTDPQCWAKNDTAKTLAAFEFQDQELFLAGMRHRQMEAVWGGRSDTAGALRGTCALALVQCREVNSTRLLGWLTELFADEDRTVRVNAARAIEQVGSDSAMLLLKLRAELASDEADVLGACYGGVLRLEGPSAIPWAAKFLAKGDDAAAEAALAIAETRAGSLRSAPNDPCRESSCDRPVVSKRTAIGHRLDSSTLRGGLAAGTDRAGWARRRGGARGVVPLRTIECGAGTAGEAGQALRRGMKFEAGDQG